MARRTFEKKTRAQNQVEIRVVRDKFSGQWSDMPGNELDPAACAEMINCCSFPDFQEPREGCAQNPNFTMPGSYTSYSITKTSNQVTLTGHTTSSSYNGYWIIYANGQEPDQIYTAYNSNTYNVMDNHAITATTAYLRPPVFGSLYHKFLNLYVLHMGYNLYVGTPASNGANTDNLTVTWVQINATGRLYLPFSHTRIREMGDWAIIFGNGNIYKVDFTHNRYWATCVNPATNTLNNGSMNTNGLFRRYLYTMTRQTATNWALWNDRTSNNLVAQETGSNLLPANGSGDYYDYYTNNIPVGDLTTTYQLLNGGSTPVLAALVGQCFFNITINSNVYTIQYNVAATATYSDIALAITNAMVATIGTDCQCNWTGTNFTWSQFQANETISYLTSPGALSGWTDVSSAILGQALFGATITTPLFYTQTALQNFTPNQYWEAFTHYSFYTTVDLTNDSGVITGDPSAFAWLGDYPIMHSGEGSDTGTALSWSGDGQFVPMDIQATVCKIYLSGGVYYASQRTILGLPTVQSATTNTSFASSGDGWYFMGAGTGAIINATSGHVTVTTYVQTWNTSHADYTPSTSFFGTIQIGTPIFCSDGNVRYVTSVTSSTDFWVDDLHFSATSMAVGVLPKLTKGNYGNEASDMQPVDIISSRIGTLGLKSRFYIAMKASAMGVVTQGFLATAYSNTFSWCTVSTDQQYIIGNNHPTYQVQEIQGIVNSLSVNQMFITLYTSTSTLVTQTNLNLTYTDTVNGNVIGILAPPLIVDLYNGVTDDRHVYDFERDMSVVVNQDFGVRTFNGYQYSNNLIYKQIQLKLKALKDFLIAYDEKYGILIYGTDVTSTLSYEQPNYCLLRAFDRVYAVGVREDKYLGSSELQNLPYPDPSCQPINVSSRSMYFALGTQNSWADGQMSRWLQDSYIDVPDVVTPTLGRDIAWSFTTSDDLASDQSIRLRHLETHLYLSGRGTYKMVPQSVTINCNIYNDVGTFITIARAINSFPLYRADINFDRRSEGNRIRYQFTFSNSYLVANGVTSYYVAYDKAATISDRNNTEYTYQTQLQTLSTWITRTVDPVDVATGHFLSVQGPCTRTTGPDGRPSSAWSTPQASSNAYLGDSSSFNSITTSTTWQVSYYIYNTALNHYLLYTDGTPAISIYSLAGSLCVSDGVNTAVSTLNSVSGWTNLLITNTAGTVSVQQDGTSITTSPNTVTPNTFGNCNLTLLRGGATVFDVRIKDTTATSTAWSYYLGNIPAGGDNVLPPG